MARLRRSLRATAPVKLTQEERYEKLISYVLEGNYSETLRQFNMPTYILADFSANHFHNKKVKNSVLESLSTDILLEIIRHLPGHNQIMAALACKTLAAVVEASTVRKIANITSYRLSSKDPAGAIWRRGHDWTSCYGKPTLPDALEWREWGFTDDSFPSTYAATNAQVAHLKPAVEKWLGRKYRFCHLCRKFRILQRSFWRAFAEYENPGITKKSSKTCAKIKELIDLWNDTSKEANDSESKRTLVACPAHDLLKERRGQRIIKAT